MRRHVRPLPLAIAAVFVVGFFGHRAADPAAPAAELAYRSVRLFLLNVDAPAGQAPWWLWPAAFLAPALLAGGAAALVSERFAEAWTRLAMKDHVVVFGTSPFSSALARAALAAGRRVVVVHDDGHEAAAAALRRHGARTLRGAPAERDSARNARVDRAAEVFITTDDDRTNATILRHVVAESAAAVFVRLDDLERARLIDHGDLSHVTPFSLPALGARDVLAGAESAETVLVVGDGPLARALVIEAARQHRAARRGAPASCRRTLLLCGRGATDELRSLRRRVEDAVPGLALDAFDLDVVGAASLEGEFRRYLAGWGRIDRAVIVGDVLAGAAGFALALSEQIGNGCAVTLLTSQPDSFDEHVGRTTQRDRHRATVDVVDILDRVRLDAIRATSVNARLRSVLGGRGCATLVLQLRNAGLEPTVSEFVAFSEPERRVLVALGIDAAPALEDAGIAVDWSSAATMEAVGKRLLRDPDCDIAFAVWCEIARRSTDGASVQKLARELERAPGITAQRALRLLRLRCATLPGGADDAPQGGACPPLPGPVVLIAGGSDSMNGPEARALDEMLRFALADGTFAGSLISGGTRPGVGGVVGGLAAGAGLHAVGFVWDALPAAERHPGYASHVVAGADCSIDQALAAWECVVAAHGHVDADQRFRAALGDVRLLACSGGSITEQEVMLARALHVPVGWLSLRPAELPLRQRLLGEDAGIITLVPDRATVRAFLRASRWDGSEPDRERLARALHASYVARHRTRKPAGDPSLRNWAQLAQGLRESNLAVIDDVPAKLAALGRRIAPLAPRGPGAPLQLGTVGAPTIDLLRLAELEHGRYNAERLRAGWEYGVRNPSLQVTPYLIPWQDLDEEAKRWDLEVVLDTFHALAEHGWGTV